MKAWVLRAVGTPPVLEDRPSPRPGPGEAVVRLRAAALNRRDLWIVEGKYPGLRLPVVLGSDGAGVVSALGEGADPAWRGREVILNPGRGWGASEVAQSDAFEILGTPRDGTFAEEVVVAQEQLAGRPEQLDWPQAAALPLAGLTAYRALFVQGGLKAGETLLITGIGGGVAASALQFAVAAGAKVWVSSSSAEKLERAKALGASGGALYSGPGWAKALRSEAGAPDLILDGAGGPGYATLVGLAAPGGRIVSYGATAGAPSSLDLFRVFWKQLRLQGSTMGSSADFAAMLGFAAAHRLVPPVDGVFPLEGADRALERMRQASQFGKIALRMRG